MSNTARDTEIVERTLYMTESCGYCRRVLNALGHLELNVALVDVSRDLEARARLEAATGKTTVPVLQLRDDNGTRWLPESTQIIFELRAAAGRRPLVPAAIDLWVDRLTPLFWGLLAASAFDSVPGREWCAAVGVAGIVIRIALSLRR